MLKTDEFLLKTGKLKFIITTCIVGFLLNLILTIVISFIFNTSVGENNYSYNENISFLSLFFGGLINPFIETLIFQHLIIVYSLKHLIGKFNMRNARASLLISAFFFGLVHLFYGIPYSVAAFCMGLYFGYITILSAFLRKEKISVLISVYLVHVTINLSALLPRYLI